jgi:hypothetical protein
MALLKVGDVYCLSKHINTPDKHWEVIKVSDTIYTIKNSTGYISRWPIYNDDNFIKGGTYVIVKSKLTYTETL